MAASKSYEYEIEYIQFLVKSEEVQSDAVETTTSWIGGSVKTDDPNNILEYVKGQLAEIEEPVKNYVAFKVWQNFGKCKLIIEQDISEHPVHVGTPIYVGA